MNKSYSYMLHLVKILKTYTQSSKNTVSQINSQVEKVESNSAQQITFSWNPGCTLAFCNDYQTVMKGNVNSHSDHVDNLSITCPLLPGGCHSSPSAGQSSSSDSSPAQWCTDVGCFCKTHIHFHLTGFFLHREHFGARLSRFPERLWKIPSA